LVRRRCRRAAATDGRITEAAEAPKRDAATLSR
jgi:hypothetical protein